jgi:hypothetical protein
MRRRQASIRPEESASFFAKKEAKKLPVLGVVALAGQAAPGAKFFTSFFQKSSAF